MPARSRRNEPLNALFHLFGGFVGEGDGEDAARVDAPLGDEPRDTMREDASLAAARAGEDEQGTVAV
jgi:hypothetical protein